ncbi:MAG TPA: ATPase domain-containing protein [Polyangiaceae bacterium]|nr:ATPase domain-containing protein [Polyangiaceae bacterium]
MLQGNGRGHDGGVPRFESGTAYLDEVLCGGWLRGGVYLIAGPPGTGKTTLANQCAYAAAGRGEPTAYVTLHAEAHDRMALHLSSLRFFDRRHVGRVVHYLSGTPALKQGGLEAFKRFVGGVVREKGARLLVIDGFSSVKEYAKGPLELRELLQALAVQASLNDCTTLLLSNEVAKGVEPENAMADGILALSADLHGLKATRGLEVIKFRGSENLPGKHTLTIGREGIKIFPRFEASVTSTSTKVPDPSRRVSWGVADLDAMCGGGLVELSNTLVLGSPGSGKTVLGLNFLAEGARAGGKSLYLGFAETGEELVRKSSNLGLDLRSLVERGALRLEARAPVETLPDELAQELTRLVDRDGHTRLFLDGLEPFAKEALDPERTTRFVVAMLNAMRERGVTVLVTQQTNELFGPELHAPIRGVEAICDNAIFLRYFELYGRLHRLIAVLKMRDSENDPFLRELELTPGGVRVGASYRTVEAVMTGQPRDRRGGAERGDPRGARPPGGARAGEAPRGPGRAPERAGGRAAASAPKRPAKPAATSPTKRAAKPAAKRAGGRRP